MKKVILSAIFLCMVCAVCGMLLLGKAPIVVNAAGQTYTVEFWVDDVLRGTSDYEAGEIIIEQIFPIHIPAGHTLEWVAEYGNNIGEPITQNTKLVAVFVPTSIVWHDVWITLVFPDSGSEVYEVWVIPHGSILSEPPEPPYIAGYKPKVAQDCHRPPQQY